MTDITETMQVAIQHHQAGRLQQAEKLYQLVLQTEPDNPAVLHSLGLMAHQTSQYDIAVNLVGRAIAANSQIPQFHNTIGIVFKALGKFQEAIDSYRQAISLQPDYAEAYNNLGIVLKAQRRYAGAIENYKQAIQLEPGFTEAYYNLANVLHEQGQYDQAIENYRQAIRFRPDFARAYNNLGTALKDHGRITEAIESYIQAIKLKPEYVEVYHNLGGALKESGRYAEAIENYKQAIQLKPDYAEVYNDMGVTLKECRHCTEAIENYKKALQLKPDYAEAHWNESLALLLSGKIAQGWSQYQRRYEDLNNITYPFQKPLWDGESFVARRLLVCCQQGVGDNIQFVRYLPMVKARGGTVIYQTNKPLINLLQNFKGIDELVTVSTDGKLAVDFDYYVSIMDLPRIFNITLQTVPADVPYIVADSTKVEFWRSKIGTDHFRVGIVWAGNPAHGNDKNRSCSLRDFLPLAAIDGLQFYGLQTGPAAAQIKDLHQDIVLPNLAEQFEDFTDTAAVIENLDLIISVDTAVLHLAGAMAKPVWALLPFAPDWRWMLDRQDS
ncbi:MAG: tetratricopeptide repeat protein, partial [Planctomycetota bacterium]